MSPLEAYMADEISKLVQKGAITQLANPHQQTFVSRIFLVPKKDGSHRPIVDLRGLNKFIRWEHFKMEGCHLVKNILQEWD